MRSRVVVTLWGAVLTYATIAFLGLQLLVRHQLSPHPLWRVLPAWQGLRGCHSAWNSPGNHSDNNDNAHARQFKSILLWNPYYDHADYMLGTLGQAPFKSGCGVQSCHITTDRCQIPTADAVIFHIRDLRDLPPPGSRPSGQLYVFFLLESPHNTFANMRRFNDVFNVTMTYRLDSDIPVPYGRTIRKAFRELAPAPFKFPLATRSRHVIWIVSNCYSQSDRRSYVHELQKHIDVDIYGHCGKKLECDAHRDCFEHWIPARYKFYLSFENSLCVDYVTEKLFGALQADILPVVYGEADYSTHAPPHSVLNIRDFQSAKHLAEYLRFLGGNEIEYSKYFAWRRDFNVLTQSAVIRDGFCDLCKLLHGENKLSRSHTDLDTWWGVRTSCREPNW